MTKGELLEILEEGIARDKRFFALKIITEGNPSAEVIVNPYENYNGKIKYIEKAYNDRLELIGALKNGKRIYIEDALATSNINDLSWFVY